jgi:hypothetical protein
MQSSAPFRPPRAARVFFVALVGVGGASLAVGLSSEPQRTWSALFLASNYAVWLATGALTLIALDAVTGARWSLPLRRLQEACVAVLPVAGIGLLAVLLFDPYLVRPGEGAGGEPSSPLRSLWLYRPYFLGRAVAYLLIWAAFAVLLIRAVRDTERSRAGLWSRTAVRVAAAFLVAFGFTCWLASYDWIMALQPDWSSTIYGVYTFAGSILSALAAVTLLAVTVRRFAPLRAVLTVDCLHDLGTLLFGFSSFWMYIWYCQYLLIWYTNHPNETGYLRERIGGAWLPCLLTSLVLNWVIPFLVLLPRWTKQSGAVLGCVSLVVLAGRWVDLRVMIGPSQGEALATFGLVEAGIALGTAGVLGLSALWSLARLPLVPQVAADPQPQHSAHPAAVAE